MIYSTAWLCPDLNRARSWNDVPVGKLRSPEQHLCYFTPADLGRTVVIICATFTSLLRSRSSLDAIGLLTPAGRFDENSNSRLHPAQHCLAAGMRLIRL